MALPLRCGSSVWTHPGSLGKGEWAGVQGRAAGPALAAPRKAHNWALPGCRACSLISDGWCPCTRCLFRGRSLYGGPWRWEKRRIVSREKLGSQCGVRELLLALRATKGGHRCGPSRRHAGLAQTRASARWWWDRQRERRAGPLYPGAAVSPRGGVGVVGVLTGSLGLLGEGSGCGNEGRD